MVSQRSPFSSLDSRINRKYLGGRPDQLASGQNIELTNIGTIIRRPGTSLWTTGAIAETSVDSFYSFHQLNGTIQVMMDGAADIWTITPTSATSQYTKSSGAGQAYFQGVGNILYVGDGVDQVAWDGINPFRNWGIAIGSINDATGPEGPGTAASVPSGTSSAWANPNNIKANDGSFSTVSLAVSSGSNTAGPNLPTAAFNGGSGQIWSNPSNIELLDGSYATSVINGNSTQLLIGTAFNFSLPSTATVKGIVVTVTRKAGSDVINTSQVADLTVQLIKNGAVVAQNKAGTAAWLTTPVAATYGSSSDLWGTTWLYSDFNSNFGLQFAAQEIWGNPNVAEIDGFQITVYYTTPSGGGSTAVSDLLEGTNFGFSLPLTNTVSGVLVQVKGLQSSTAGVTFTAQLMKAGAVAGTAKVQNLGLSNAFITFGSTVDLWNTTLGPTDVNNTGFGVALQATNSTGTSVTFSVDYVQIIIYGTGGPTIALVSGSLTTTNGGYQYVYAYGNSTSGAISNPTPASASTGDFSAKNVNVTLIASTDTQVNQIHVYRTKDGGGVYYELPTSPYSNTNQTITDSNADSTLNTLVFWPGIPWLGNSPPPVGLTKMAYHLGRIWGVVGNYVYYSAGPDSTIGNGNEAFPPANYFLFPSTVNRLVPYSSGLLVFTTDDVYIILGTSLATFYAMPFQQGVGLLSYNALDVQGTNIFMYTSDRQFLQLSSSGINEIGYAIGNFLENAINPALAYTASIIAGTSEKAVYLSDGAMTWYRCNWNQPPEGGPAWSPAAVIAGGCNALTSVETSPGVHQLLMAYSSGGNSYVLYRNTGIYTDYVAGASVPYTNCFMIFGSLVMAQPGQIAEIDSIVLELTALGSVPSVSILTDEITGVFESLPIYTNDPPELTPSVSVMSNRWYLSQGPNAARLRHMQIQISYNQDTVRNELLTLSVFGGLIHEA